MQYMKNLKGINHEFRAQLKLESAKRSKIEKFSLCE